jgi:hypothetical protein
MLYPCNQCGNRVEFDTIVDRLCPQCRGHSVDEISENEIKPRSFPHKTAYLAFIVLGLISLWVSYLTFGAVEGVGGHIPGLPGVIGFLVIIPLGIPLILAVFFGPFLSLFTGWGDGYLMSMTGLSYLLFFSLLLASATALSWLFLAYGIACLVICVIGITKNTE